MSKVLSGHFFWKNGDFRRFSLEYPELGYIYGVTSVERGQLAD